jgi:hypothetical protein
LACTRVPKTPGVLMELEAVYSLAILPIAKLAIIATFG